MTTPLLLDSGRVQYLDPAPDDGAVSALSLTRAGRLRVEPREQLFAPSSEGLTAVDSYLAVDVTEASNLFLHLKNSGLASMTGVSAYVFEASIDSTNGIDGTWFAVRAVRSNANVVESAVTGFTMASGEGAPYGWALSVNAIRWFRVRCTAAGVAGTIATWTAIRGSRPSEPIPAAQPVAIAGTATVAGTVAVSGVAGTTTVAGTVTANNPTGTNYFLVSAATTNASVIKSSAGNLNELTVFNPTAATIYGKLYNKATAPTVGTDVPIFSFAVGVNAASREVFGAIGKRFSAGIALALTAGPLATDAVAIAAGVQVSATYV